MKRREFAAISLSALGAAYLANPTQVFASSPMSDELWPCWRGPLRNGYSPAKAWPEGLDDSHLQVLWETALDFGYSGPIVTGDSVFVTETQNKKYEVVRCLERASGREKWQQKWEGSMTVPFFAKSNGDWIRSTPAADGSHLFVGGMRDVLASLALKDGSEQWRIDFPAKLASAIPDFGMVCSPLIDGDALYVQAGGGLVKIDTKSGEILWRVLDDGGGMNGSAFSSPIIAELHGRRQLLVQSRSALYGIEISDGSTIWKKDIESFRGMNILTPTVWNDSVFTSSYGGKAWLFGFEPAATGEWKVNTLWENKVQAYMSSPLVVGESLYVHLRNQRFVCLDMKSGKEHWTSRPYGKYWSMITNGEKILALDETGMLYLIQPNTAEFTILSERKVSENECWAHLALVDDQLFVRHLKGLTVFRWS